MQNNYNITYPMAEYAYPVSSAGNDQISMINSSVSYEPAQIPVINKVDYSNQNYQQPQPSGSSFVPIIPQGSSQEVPIYVPVVMNKNNIQPVPVLTPTEKNLLDFKTITIEINTDSIFVGRTFDWKIGANTVTTQGYPTIYWILFGKEKEAFWSQSTDLDLTDNNGYSISFSLYTTCGIKCSVAVNHVPIGSVTTSYSSCSISFIVSDISNNPIMTIQRDNICDIYRSYSIYHDIQGTTGSIHATSSSLTDLYSTGYTLEKPDRCSINDTILLIAAICTLNLNERQR
ncbi:hypothetical protein WA158_000518 [Blastocystis sp. Blastoise]